MTRPLLLLTLALAACANGEKAETTREPTAPVFGRMTEISEVLDSRTRQRVGFLERCSYEDGRVIYWVSGPARDERLGFILATGRAYRYVWYAGRRSPEPEDLGADVREVGARRILGHEHTVVFQPTSLEKLKGELTPPAPKKAPPKGAPAEPAEGEESGCGCGEE
jgi:hypothetical protein